MRMYSPISLLLVLALQRLRSLYCLDQYVVQYFSHTLAIGVMDAVHHGGKGDHSSSLALYG